MKFKCPCCNEILKIESNFLSCADVDCESEFCRDGVEISNGEIERACAQMSAKFNRIEDLKEAAENQEDGEAEWADRENEINFSELA